MNKNIIRALIVALLALGGLGLSTMSSPAQAAHHLCHDEPLPGDVWVEVGSTAGAGADTGTTGLVVVPVACVQLGGTVIGAGGGVTVERTSTGARIQPWTCNAHYCTRFLIPVG